MPRQINYNGVVHSFPDDATDDEISAALEAEDNKNKPGGQSAFTRFLSGLASTAIPSKETAEMLGSAAADPMGGLITVKDGKVHLGLPNVAQLWSNVGRGIVGGAVDQLRKAGISDTSPFPPTVEQLGHLTAATVPVVGPAAAHAGERIREGDVAGGLGEAAGLVAPMAVARTPSASGVAEGLESGAAQNVAKAIASGQPNYVPAVIRGARTLSRDLGSNTSTAQMLEAVKGPEALSGAAPSADSILGQAISKLEAEKGGISAGGQPIDLSTIEDAIRAKYPRIATPEEAPVTAPESLNTAQVNAADRMADMVKRARESYGVSTGPQKHITIDPTTHVMTIEDVAPEIIPGDVPAGEVLKMRTQAGDLGRFNTNPLGEPSPEAAVGSYTQGLLSQQLHNAFPRLAAADERFSLYNTVGDLLQKRAQADAVARPSALQTMAARGGLRGVLGAVTGGAALGGLEAGAHGAFLGGALSVGAYGLYRMAEQLMASPRWNMMSAARKFQIADAVRAGNLSALENALKGAAVGSEVVQQATNPNHSTPQ